MKLPCRVETNCHRISGDPVHCDGVDMFLCLLLFLLLIGIFAGFFSIVYEGLSRVDLVGIDDVHLEAE